MSAFGGQKMDDAPLAPEVSAGLDRAAVSAGASFTRDRSERRRGLAFRICESERAGGLGGCIAAHLENEAAFRERLAAILAAALAGREKLAPHRYRLIWTIRNGG